VLSLSLHSMPKALKTRGVFSFAVVEDYKIVIIR
jgi:hypothetical protein